MMRRAMYARMCALVFLAAAAVPASAQMPPSIKGPIDAAKRQANKTSAQINEEQRIGNDPGKAAAMPATSAQQKGSAAQKGAPAQKTAPVDAKAAAAAAKAAASADSAKKRGSVTQNGTK